MRPVRYTWWLETGSIYLVAIGFSVDRCRGRVVLLSWTDYSALLLWGGSTRGEGPWLIQPISATSRAHASRLASPLRRPGSCVPWAKAGYTSAEAEGSPTMSAWQGGSSSSPARCGKSHSFAYPVISPLRWLMQVACSCYAFVSSLSRATRSCSSFALLMRYSNSRPL
jgi:hypothetical protein